MKIKTFPDLKQKVTFHLVDDEAQKELYRSDRLSDMWTFLKQLTISENLTIEEKENNKLVYVFNAEYFMNKFSLIDNVPLSLQSINPL